MTLYSTIYYLVMLTISEWKIAQIAMDQLPTPQKLSKIIEYLYNATRKMKYNKEECQRLCSHTEQLVRMIQEQTEGVLSPRLEANLVQLSTCVLSVRARSFRPDMQSCLAH